MGSSPHRDQRQWVSVGVDIVPENARGGNTQSGPGLKRIEVINGRGCSGWNLKDDRIENHRSITAKRGGNSGCTSGERRQKNEAEPEDPPQPPRS